MKFGKIFEQMYDSSIANDWEAMVTFQQLIILCSFPEGVVDMTPRSISARTGIPIEYIQKGLDILSKPDPESRSKEEDGKRIVPLLDADGEPRPWGWKIVNYAKYRQKMAEEERRLYRNEWSKNKRAALVTQKEAPVQIPTPMQTDTHINHVSEPISPTFQNDDDTRSETRSDHGHDVNRHEHNVNRHEHNVPSRVLHEHRRGEERRGEERKRVGAPPATPDFAQPSHEKEQTSAHGGSSPASLSKARPASSDEVRAEIGRLGYHVDPEAFFAHYETNGWRQKGGNRITNWKAALVTWERNELKGFGGNNTRPIGAAPALSPTDNEARRRKALGLPLFEPKGAG